MRTGRRKGWRSCGVTQHIRRPVRCAGSYHVQMSTSAGNRRALGSSPRPENVMGDTSVTPPPDDTHVVTSGTRYVPLPLRQSSAEEPDTSSPVENLSCETPVDRPRGDKLRRRPYRGLSRLRRSPPLTRAACMVLPRDNTSPEEKSLKAQP